MTYEGSTPLAITDVRAVQKRLLKAFAAFCEDNSLTYMLAYGTLLGAIRHHGFIPWDDDVDVMMPRPDYERLMSLRDDLERCAGAGLRSSTGGSDLYPWSFAKLFDPATTQIDRRAGDGPLGINIEIFPVDGWPDGRLRREMLRGYMRILAGYVVGFKTWTTSRPGRFPDSVYRAGRRLFSVVPMGVLVRHITQVAQRGLISESMFAGVIVGFDREVVKISDLLPTSVGEFEGDEYRVPANPDAVLSALYGDYMTPPPVEQRVAPHAINAFDIPLKTFLKRVDTT
jgi:lipopolysaccharide cholinephosphotransferase